MSINTPIKSITIDWVIDDSVGQETATGDVNVTCEINNTSNSFHLYTLGPEDTLCYDSVQGAFGQSGGSLRFERASTAKAALSIPYSNGPKLSNRNSPIATPTLVHRGRALGLFTNSMCGINNTTKASTSLSAAGTMVDTPLPGSFENSSPVTSSPSWSRSPDFESRYSRDLWDSSYSEDMEFDTSMFSHLRNTSTRAHIWQPSSSTDTSQVEPRLPELDSSAEESNILMARFFDQGCTSGDGSSRSQDAMDIYAYERGGCEKIGKLRIVRDVTGRSVIIDICRQLPGTLITIQFQLTHKLLIVRSDEHISNPLQKSFWTKLSVVSLPKFEMSASMQFSTFLFQKKEYNVLAELTDSLFAEKSFYNGFVLFTFKRSGRLGSIPLKRNVNLNIYRSFGLKEAPISFLPKATTVRLFDGNKPNGDEYIRAQFVVEFNAKIIYSETETCGSIALGSLYINDGPDCEAVEVRHNCRYLSQCTVQLSEDRSQSEIRIALPYDKFDENFDMELQFVFEKQLPSYTAVLYVPQLVNTYGRSGGFSTTAAGKPADIFVYNKSSQGVTFNVLNSNQWELVDSQLKRYSASKRMRGNAMVLRLAECKQANASLRDISYRLGQRSGDVYCGYTGLFLEISVVVDISYSQIGSCILRMSTTGLWGCPSNVQIDGETAEKNSSYCCLHDYVEVFQRNQPQLRDLEIKLTWDAPRPLAEKAIYFSGNIPHIVDQELENVQIAVNVPAAKDGYVKCGIVTRQLQDCKLIDRFPTSEPIFVCIGFDYTAKFPQGLESDEVLDIAGEDTWAIFVLVIGSTLMTIIGVSSYMMYCTTVRGNTHVAVELSLP